MNAPSDQSGRIAELEATIAYLATRHHDTITPSRKHDPETREWWECDCTTCRHAQDALAPAEDDPPIDRCPFCEDDGVESKGRYEGRVLIGGRGMYICERDRTHRWQNAAEKPTTCGVSPPLG